MIVFKTFTGKEIRFNLKNQEREQQLCNVVSQLKQENSTSTIKITTSYHEQLAFKATDVEKCEFVDSEYIRSHVHTQSKNQESNFTDSAMNLLEKNQKKNVEEFLDLVRKKGIEPDLNDPILLRIIQSVKESTRSKIPIYANLYVNSKNYR